MGRADREFVTFLRWTGQHRTIGAMATRLTLGALMLLALPWVAERDIGVEIAFPTFLIGGPLFVLHLSGWRIVRCPGCGTRVVWQALGNQSHPHGLENLFAATRCPYCRFPDA